ncbi:hypothetical protein [Streptomyces sp. NPDC004134]
MIAPYRDAFQRADRKGARRQVRESVGRRCVTAATFTVQLSN